MRRYLIGLLALGFAVGCGVSNPAGDPPADGPAGTAPADGGATDAAVAPGSPDGAPADLGSTGPDLGDPAGPWPTADLTPYGASSGLDAPILDSSADDAQNIWAASAGALYLLRPGHTTFEKFTAADGLHIGPFTDPTGSPAMTNITAIAAGRGDEVFVGYQGYETLGDPYQDTEAQKELGNADRVTVDAAGKLTVVRYLFRCDYEHSTCWENRSPRRMIFAHTGIAAGHLFIGFNHGVSHVYADQFGDHVHPEVWYVGSDGSRTEKIGEWYGLALTPAGDLWMGGRYGVGLQPWNAVPHFSWVDGRFIYAFTIYSGDHGLDVPVGYREDERAIAVAPDGTVWFASLTHGLASWNPQTTHGNYQQIVAWGSKDGLPTDLVDVAADPDGTLWLVTSGGALERFNPASGTVTAWPGVSGVRRIHLDQTVTPRALYLAMDSGVAVIRAK